MVAQRRWKNMGGGKRIKNTNYEHWKHTSWNNLYNRYPVRMSCLSSTLLERQKSGHLVTNLTTILKIENFYHRHTEWDVWLIQSFSTSRNTFVARHRGTVPPSTTLHHTPLLCSYICPIIICTKTSQVYKQKNKFICVPPLIVAAN